MIFYRKAMDINRRPVDYYRIFREYYRSFPVSLQEIYRNSTGGHGIFTGSYGKALWERFFFLQKGV